MTKFRVTYKGDPGGLFWNVEATSKEKAVQQVAHEQGLNPKLLTASPT